MELSGLDSSQGCILCIVESIMALPGKLCSGHVCLHKWCFCNWVLTLSQQTKWSGILQQLPSHCRYVCQLWVYIVILNMLFIFYISLL